MNIKIKDQDYYLTFQYTVQETKLGARDVTTATIKKDGVPVTNGITIRNPKDSHVKHIARVQSFRDLLQKLELNKEERSAVWLEFRNQVK